MRAIGPTPNIPSVTTGSANWPRTARSNGKSPASAASMLQKPVRPGAGEHAVQPAERRRRPVEQVVEHEDQHQAEKECRRGLADRRDGAA